MQQIGKIFKKKLFSYANINVNGMTHYCDMQRENAQMKT